MDLVFGGLFLTFSFSVISWGMLLVNVCSSFFRYNILLFPKKKCYTIKLVANREYA